jgi:hypothetical protein
MSTNQEQSRDAGETSHDASRVDRFLNWARTADAPLSIFLGLIVASTVLSWALWEFLPAWAFDVFFVATMIFGVIVLVSSPRLAFLAGLLGVVAVVFRLAGFGPVTLVGTSTSMAFFLLVSIALLRRVFLPGQVTVHRLTGAVALFVVLAVTWGFAFQIICLVRPGALLANGLRASPQDAMWFSFVTITTVGYGDVVAVMPIARSLAGMEALTGVLYPAVLIGALLGDFARQRRQEGR